MHRRIVSLLLVLLATAVVTMSAQALISTGPVAMSVTTPNESAKVASLTCMSGAGTRTRIETPIWIQWVDFKALKFRKGNNTLYQALGTFDKSAEKLTGPNIKVSAFSASNTLNFAVDYSTDEGKTWQRRTFEAKTSLDCLPAGSNP